MSTPDVLYWWTPEVLYRRLVSLRRITGGAHVEAYATKPDSPGVLKTTRAATGVVCGNLLYLACLAWLLEHRVLCCRVSSPLPPPSPRGKPATGGLTGSAAPEDPDLRRVHQELLSEMAAALAARRHSSLGDQSKHAFRPVNEERHHDGQFDFPNL